MEPMSDASTVERMILKRASFTRTPVNGSLELLPLCNMNCDMCYVRLSRAEMEQQGRMRTAEEWIEIGKQMQKSGVLFLLLTGGEPLLHPEFKKIYLNLKAMGMILTINTNGTLINEEWADFFAANRPRRINITLYGADDKAYERLCHYPGGYRKVMRAVHLLKERKVDVKLSGSLTKENRDDLARLLDVQTELDIPVRVDTYMMPAERERTRPFAEQSRLAPEEAARGRMFALQKEMGKELFEVYVKQTLTEIDHAVPQEATGKRMTCLAGSCSFTVNWQGEIRPCVVMTGPSASVFELGFQKAWEQMSHEIDKIVTSPHCAVCKKRVLCRTCAASALLETGSYDGVPEYMCRYTEESLRILREYGIKNSWYH